MTHPDGLVGFDPLGWITRALGLTGPPPTTPTGTATSSPLGWPLLTVLICVLAGAVALAGMWAVRRWSVTVARRRARWARGARFVEILPPPTVDTAGAHAFWAQLAGLARDPWQRLSHGQPHVTFEIHAEPARLRIGCWVPSVISPRRIEHTIRAAWPGALTRTHRLDLPDPLGRAGAHANRAQSSAPLEGSESAAGELGDGLSGPAGVVCAGWLPLGRHPAWPLRTEHDTDPLRAVLGALAGLRPGQTACIQICARPASGAVAARFRRSAINPAHGHTGRLLTSLGTYLPPAWSHTLSSPISLMAGPLAAIVLPAVIGVVGLTAKLLARAMIALTSEGLGLIAGLFAPTPRDRAHHPRTVTAAGAAARPVRAAAVAASRGPLTAGPATRGGGRTAGVDRAVARKTNQATGLWEVQLRYTSTLTPPPEQVARLTPAGWRRVRRACVGHAGELAGAMAIYSGHNHLLRRPLHPGDWPALAGRWMNGGQLMSTTELAALAHLPTDARVPGLTRAGSVAVDQPPELLTG